MNQKSQDFQYFSHNRLCDVFPGCKKVISYQSEKKANASQNKVQFCASELKSIVLKGG